MSPINAHAKDSCSKSSKPKSDTPKRDARPDRSGLKCNSLVDPGDHRCALYKASRCGRVRSNAHRAWHLLSAPRRPGSVGKHPRKVDHRAISRTRAHFRFRPRHPVASPQSRALHLVRGLDAAQSRPPCGGVVANHERDGASAGAGADHAGQHHRQSTKLSDFTRWFERPHRAAPERRTVQRAQVFHDEPVLVGPRQVSEGIAPAIVC